MEVHASRKHMPRIRTRVGFQTGISRPECPQTGHEVLFVRPQVDPATSLRHFSWLKRDSCAPGRLLQPRNLASKAEEANSVLAWVPADTIHLSTPQQHSQCMRFLSVVANCHKLSGLKQSRFIILKFWRSEIWKALFLQAALAGNLLCFPASRGSQHSLACDPFLQVQSLCRSITYSPNSSALFHSLGPL